MHRPNENLDAFCFVPAIACTSLDVAGRLPLRRIGAELTTRSRCGGAMYGAFSGLSGSGRMELNSHPVGGDAGLLPCLRALDYSPPRRLDTGISP